MKSVFKTFSSIITISLTTGIISLSIIYAQAPSIKFDHITIADGLSQNTINCILQDNKGFIWFGTQDGLNKYDGYDFTVYKHDPLDTTSISDNYIRCIFEDQNGVLWVGTENGGLNRFDRTTGKFKRYIHDSANPNSIANNRVWSVIEDNSGNLLIGTWGGGLARLDLQTEQFIHFQHNPADINSISDNRIRCLYIDKGGVLWIGTEDGGLNRFDSKSKIFNRYQHNPDDSLSISHNRVQAIHEDGSGNLWIGTKKGLNRFDRERETFTQFSLTLHWKRTEVISIEEDQSGILWIGTHMRGLCRFNTEKVSFRYIQYDQTNPNSLNLDGITTVYIDGAGIIWVGTNGAGVDRFDPTPKFRYYTHILNDSNSLSKKSIRGIYEDRDSVLWIGSYGGLDKFDRRTGQTRNYRADKLQDSTTLTNSSVYAVKEDLAGSLLLGTEGGGLYRYNRVTDKFTQYQHKNNNPHSLCSDVVYFFYTDRLGDLWIGTDDGLSRLKQSDWKTKNFTNYRHESNNALSLVGTPVNSILEDQQGALWIGTDLSGLSRFDRERLHFKNYVHNNHDPKTLSSNRIKCLYEDRSGVLWVGTSGGGLNRFDFKSETFKHYTEKDGLPNDVVYGIMEDDHGNLWISTNKGLSKFNPATETFRNYDTWDGLQSNEFNSGSFHKSWTGEMFFGGINGLNAFFPDSVKDDPHIPPVVITGFQIFNEPVPIGNRKGERSILQKHITETEALTFSYRERVFSFEFAALNFSAPEKNLYAYKMVGFDEKWVYTDADQRFTTYTNLPAGKYTFRVKGSNQDGVWNETGTFIGITVTPPPWKTWWAYTIYVLVVIGLVMGTVQWRLWQMKRRTIVLEKLVVERTAEIRRNEQELEKQYNFLDSVIESLSHPFYVIEVDTYATVLANSAARQGMKTGHLRCYEFIFGRDKPCSLTEHYCPLVDVKKTKKSIKFVQIRKGKDGNTIYTEINAYPIFDQDGNVAQVIEYWIDITARKELENTLKENLEQRNKELTTKAMRMAKNREVLIGIVKDVQNLYLKSHVEDKTHIRTVMTKLNEQINSGGEWDEFELWFQEVHKDFYTKLNKRYPDLATREMKICAFLKLNLNTKEIASLTNLTVKTIEVYRSNLRKRLNVPSGINLVNFISEI